MLVGVSEVLASECKSYQHHQNSTLIMPTWYSPLVHYMPAALPCNREQEVLGRKWCLLSFNSFILCHGNYHKSQDYSYSNYAATHFCVYGNFHCSYRDRTSCLGWFPVISTYIPLEQASHLPQFSLQSSGLKYFKELGPCFPQNLDQDAKCPGVSQAIKTWHFWECKHFELPTVGSHLQEQENHQQPTNRKERCVDSWL